MTTDGLLTLLLVLVAILGSLVFFRGQTRFLTRKARALPAVGVGLADLALLWGWGMWGPQGSGMYAGLVESVIVMGATPIVVVVVLMLTLWK